MESELTESEWELRSAVIMWLSSFGSDVRATLKSVEKGDKRAAWARMRIGETPAGEPLLAPDGRPVPQFPLCLFVERLEMGENARPDAAANFARFLGRVVRMMGARLEARFEEDGAPGPDVVK